jgi:hypothetical protein
MRAIEAGGPLGDEPIEHLARELRLRRLREDPLAHLRIDAVGPDDQAVALAMAVGEFDFHAAGNLRERLDGGTQAYVHAGGQRPGGQNLVQIRAHDAAVAGQVGRNLAGT